MRSCGRREGCRLDDPSVLLLGILRFFHRLEQLIPSYGIQETILNLLGTRNLSRLSERGVLLGERGVLLFRDPHAKQEFNLLTVPDGALETEQGSVFDPGGDGNREDQGVPACVKPNIPLRTFEGLIGCQGEIVDG